MNSDVESYQKFEFIEKPQIFQAILNSVILESFGIGITLFSLNFLDDLRLFTAGIILVVIAPFRIFGVINQVINGMMMSISENCIRIFYYPLPSILYWEDIISIEEIHKPFRRALKIKFKALKREVVVPKILEIAEKLWMPNQGFLYLKKPKKMKLRDFGNFVKSCFAKYNKSMTNDF